MLDSWTFNKIAGAVLATALTVFGLKEVVGAIYHPNMASHDKPGYKIEVVEDAGHGGSEGGGEVVADVPIGTLLASADATKGAGEAKSACGSCHDFTKGGPKKTGPNLWDIVERPHATMPDFTYSEGMAALAGKPWGYEDLNAFIKNPKAAVKGTKMGYGGLKNDEKRANLIAYLATLSDSPKPFPPAAAAPAAGEAAPAAEAAPAPEATPAPQATPAPSP